MMPSAESRRLVKELLHWNDPVPRDGALNMAIDECLARQLDQPLLRLYRWAEPVFSMGYFFPWEAAAAEVPGGVSLVRRWTGGGLVDHRRDRTFTLFLPRPGFEHLMTAGMSYRWVHECLAAALRQTGVEATLVAESVSTGGNRENGSCFERPVTWDVVLENGEKLAGGAQRRTRNGLLHQGSVQAPDNGWEDFFVKMLAEESECFKSWEPSEEILTEAQILTDTRYGTGEWLRKF